MHDPLVAGIYLDEGLATTEFSAPMQVEPHEGRHRAIARNVATHPHLADRRPARIFTDADLTAFLDRFTDALTTPLPAR
jgi:hypothetical protein